MKGMTSQEPNNAQVDLMLGWMADQRDKIRRTTFWQEKHLRAPIRPVGYEIVLNRWFIEPYRLQVISSVGWYGDDVETADAWWHVSVSHPKRTPTWEKMGLVKETLLGITSDAYMVYPPESEYVNLHENVLHWWARQDGERVLPGFSIVLNGVRTI